MGEGIGVATTAGITVGITDGTGVAAGVGSFFGDWVGGWTVVDGGATAGEEETGCPASVLTGVASSPPHAPVNNKMNSAATGSNLGGKVRTRIPTLP